MRLNISDENKLLGGVYKIRNIGNNRIYIGSTKMFSQRFREHCSVLKNNKHSPYLQNDYNKSSANSFVFEMVEIVFPISESGAELLQREQMYLDKYFDGKVNCYNINPLASSRKGTKNNWTEEDRIKCSNERKNRWKDPVFKNKMKALAKERYEQNKEAIDTVLKIARDRRLGAIMSNSTKEKLASSHRKTFDTKLASPAGELFGPIENLIEFCKKNNVR